MTPRSLKRHIQAASWLAALAASLLSVSAEVRGAELSSNLPAQHLDRWAKSPVVALQINRGFPSAPGGSAAPAEEGVRLDTFALPIRDAVVGFGVSGTVQLNGRRSLVRVVLLDEDLKEYLVYEGYPLLVPAIERTSLSLACRETCILPAVIPSALRVETIDATMTVRSVELSVAPRAALNAREQAARARSARQVQEREIVRTLNAQVRAKGLRWTAGETSISQMTWAQKRSLFPCVLSRRHPSPPPTVPNLQGLEYYSGGIFELPPMTAVQPTSRSPAALVSAFDWRARHRANDPNSPYYDGDPTGSGWMTSVKSQRCGDCWAHCVNGAVEANANLYFNRHLDLDLAEQELVSCAQAGGCAGGYPDRACGYVRDSGVVDEQCFPESGRDEPCSNRCAAPHELIQIYDSESFAPASADDIQRRLIQRGPLTFGILSWRHVMVLVGYGTDVADGQPVWTLKNSWGPDWGENGYVRLKVDLANIGWTNDLVSPVYSLIQNYAVACRDEDRDGYYSWGTAAQQPTVCGNAPSINDCNDWDPRVALQKEDGSCVAACQVTITQLVAQPQVLWPPNHKMSTVNVTAVADDTCDAEPACRIVAVTSNERAADAAKPDWQVVGDLRANLRAARAGSRDGRVYTISVRCVDPLGSSASKDVTVTVPHDQGSGK
jgi:hypothetical protein